MANIYDKIYFENAVVSSAEAHLSVASAAVLYGLSVYTVFPLLVTDRGRAAFRLKDHYGRLVNSARVIGIDTFEPAWPYEKFEQAVKEVVAANNPKAKCYARATVHVAELLPGTRSRGLKTTVSIFLYEAPPMFPEAGARLKTSVWRRVPDYAIPARAKVNGAYVNSVLGKQDALDSGYDDCIFLDAAGHVCELSTANIFLVRSGVLITPGATNDLLEGISRRTILDLAAELNIPTIERTVDLTELYIADEIFACGTSSYIAPVKEIDARVIGRGVPGPITAVIKDAYTRIFTGKDESSARYLTTI